MEFNKDEIIFIYNLLLQCQYGQVKDLCLKIEKYLNS